ncbi:MAG: AAA family ATPase [Candidatus Njordarchaeales archaeon]
MIIYGRRRVGKTRLLAEFAKDKPHIYYIATEFPYEIISKEFSDSVKEFLHMPISGDLVEVLDAIADIYRERLLIVLDEFQYIVDGDPTFPSRL